MSDGKKLEQFFFFSFAKKAWRTRPKSPGTLLGQKDWSVACTELLPPTWNRPHSVWYFRDWLTGACQTQSDSFRIGLILGPDLSKEELHQSIDFSPLPMYLVFPSELLEWNMPSKNKSWRCYHWNNPWPLCSWS